MAEKNSLWKNIRNKAKQNRRTGATPKKPTAEMLRQERKIKAKKYAEGGETDPPYRPLSIPMEGYEPDSAFYETPSRYSEPEPFSQPEPVNKKEDKPKPTSKRSEVQDYYLNQYLNQNSFTPKPDRYVAERDATSTKVTPAMSTKESFEGELRQDNPIWDQIKYVVDSASLSGYYPASVVGSIMDAVEGDYTGAAIGLVPIVGKAGKHGRLWSQAYTKLRNSGVSEPAAQAIKKYGKKTSIIGSYGVNAADAKSDLIDKYSKGGKLYAEGDSIDPPSGTRYITPTRQDSLMLYNNALDKIRFYSGNPDYKKTASNTNFKDPKVRKNLIWDAFEVDPVVRSPLVEQIAFNAASKQDAFTSGIKPSKPMSADEKRKMQKQVGLKKFGKVADTNLTSLGDVAYGQPDVYYNPLAPPIYLHPNISPQGSEAYISQRLNDFSDIPNYDPLAVAPWDTLNEKQKEERVKKYGTSGTPLASASTRVTKPSINRLQSKQYSNSGSNQQPGIIGNVENISPLEINMDKFYEGQYEKYRRSPYEDPMYRVQLPNQQMQILPESEFKKLNDQYALKDLEQKAYGGYMYKKGGPFGVDIDENKLLLVGDNVLIAPPLPEFEVFGNYDYGDKTKPTYLSPEELGFRQIMEPDSTRVKSLNNTEANSVFDKPLKKNPKNPYKEINSTKADFIRSALPVPMNVGQMISKEVFKDARMSNESLSDEEKIVLWNTIQNAKKRTGKDNGGTEYSDYESEYGSKEDFNNWFNRGKLGATDLVYNSISNPGFRVASTVGRGRYWTDPNNPDNIQYTDVYDWNSSEKNYKGNNLYQKLRNEVRNNEQKNLDTLKNEPYRMNFSFNKQEIEELIKQQTRKKEIDRAVSDVGIPFAYGGPMQYKRGGLLKDIGLGVADFALSTIGGVTGIQSMKDIVNEKQYSNDKFDAGANFAGSIGSTALKLIPVTAPIANAAGIVGGAANKAFGIDAANYNPNQEVSDLEKAGNIVGQAGNVASMFMGNTSGISANAGKFMQGVDKINKFGQSPAGQLLNQGLSFEQGGNINNNSVNLQNSTMKRYKDYKTKYKQGGIIQDKLEANNIYEMPSYVGEHWQHPDGGAPMGPNASVEAKELVRMEQGGRTGVNTPTYVDPATVNGTHSIMMPQMTSDNKMITDKNGLPKFSKKSPAQWLKEKLNRGSEFRVEVDRFSEPSNQQVMDIAEGGREVAVSVNELKQQAAQEDAMRIAMADNVAAYGGYLSKYRNLNMPKSKANGGSIGDDDVIKNDRSYKVRRNMFDKIVSVEKYTDEDGSKWKIKNKYNPDTKENVKTYWVNGKFSGKTINQDEPEYMPVKQRIEFNNQPSVVYAVGGPLYGNTDSEYTYAHGGPVVSNVPQDFDLYAQNRGGMMMANGGMMPQDNGMSKQIAAALKQGTKPEEILSQLIESGMDPQQAQAMLQAIMGNIQPQAPMMAMGGRTMYAEGDDIPQYAGQLGKESWLTTAAGIGQVIPDVAAGIMSARALKKKDYEVKPFTVEGPKFNAEPIAIGMRGDAASNKALITDALRNSGMTAAGLRGSLAGYYGDQSKALGKSLTDLYTQKYNIEGQGQFQADMFNAKARADAAAATMQGKEGYMQDILTAGQGVTNKLANYYANRQKAGMQQWQAENTKSPYYSFTTADGKTMVAFLNPKDGNYYDNSGNIIKSSEE